MKGPVNLEDTRISNYLRNKKNKSFNAKLMKLKNVLHYRH